MNPKRLLVACCAALCLVAPVVPAQDLDFGDAPDPTYPTLLANNGAWHVIGGPWLGDLNNAPDAEVDGQPGVGALGDDFNALDDEDATFFPPLLIGVATNFTFEVNGTGGVVEIWLDFNRDGVWQHPAELIHAGPHAVGLHSVVYALPPAATEGSTYVRMRISSGGTGTPEGPAADGEVEDHHVFQYESTADWSNLQWPPSTTTLVGVPTEVIYGQVWIDGVTAQAGATPGLVAELGYGPDGSSPVANPQWTWVGAVYNVDVGNNDEYMGTLTVPQPGVYDYGYRYSWFGGPYTYADLDGSPNGFDPAQAGSLLVRFSEAQCPKWQQPIDCAYGLDVPSVMVTNLPPVWVADDFISDGRPITALRWWGSYPGYGGSPELHDAPPGLRPVAFEVRWYTDVLAGVHAPWSMPGTLIASAVAPLLPYATPISGPGMVSEQFACTTDLSWAQPLPTPAFEHEYAYTLELESPWLEKEGHVYWLAVSARYDEPTLTPWGWKTTPVPYNWNDDAVFGVGSGSNWMEMVYPPPGWTAITNHPYRGQSVNLAFELLTDVCPRRCKKWEQPPDMILGNDMSSWRHLSEPEGGVLRADDFVSDGRLITDLHWWGSYPGWMHAVPGEVDTAPVPPPPAPFRPLGFDLSWHLHDDISGGPGLLITNLFVPMDACHEVYYGPVDQSFWREELFIEHEYQYYVDLLDPEVSGLPWAEEAGVAYWVNIQAVFPDDFVPGEPHEGWGWKTTPMLGLEWSRMSMDGGGVWVPGLHVPPHPLAGQPVDLAFELTTMEIPDTNSPWHVELAITNFVHQAPPGQWLVTSLGDCGCGHQVLQSTTNLLDAPTAFRDEWTNVLPRAVNLWPVANTNRHAFFRVQKRP